MALTELARSRRESTRVPSRSNIRRLISWAGMARFLRIIHFQYIPVLPDDLKWKVLQSSANPPCPNVIRRLMAVTKADPRKNATAVEEAPSSTRTEKIYEGLTRQQLIDM